MPQPRVLSPWQQAILGACISLAAIGVALACGTGTQRVPQLAQCQLDALRVLPTDPNMATVYDVVDIIQRVRACHRQYVAGDAGP